MNGRGDYWLWDVRSVFAGLTVVDSATRPDAPHAKPIPRFDGPIRFAKALPGCPAVGRTRKSPSRTVGLSDGTAAAQLSSASTMYIAAPQSSRQPGPRQSNMYFSSPRSLIALPVRKFLPHFHLADPEDINGLQQHRRKHGRPQPNGQSASVRSAGALLRPFSAHSIPALLSAAESRQRSPEFTQSTSLGSGAEQCCQTAGTRPEPVPTLSQAFHKPFISLNIGRLTDHLLVSPPGPFSTLFDVIVHSAPRWLE